MHYESQVERAIREATERGEFSGLAGSGKPLDLGNTDDPDWWVKRYLQREGLDASATMPPVMQLRAEAAGYPHSLLDTPDEACVREILRDYNLRVVADRRRPVVGRAMPLTAPRIDVEAMVERWRELRAQQVASTTAQPRERAAGATAAQDEGPAGENAPANQSHPSSESSTAAPQRRWWRVRRWRRR